MFFPIGWPRVLNFSQPEKICSITCNRDKILFGILTIDAISIWYCKPCLPLVFQKRSKECIQKYGENYLLEWRPDSSMLAVATTGSYLLFYKVCDQSNEVRSPYRQKDTAINSLKRDGAELFIKDSIPSLTLKFEKSTWIDGGITSFVCIRDELMISTKTSFVIRQRWDGTQNRDYSLDLRRIPFSIDQQISTAAAPLTSESAYITDIDYSPLVGGFVVIFNCGKAAFLTAESLKFDPNQVQGVWAKDINDATCASVNHKYRLIAFGRKNSHCLVLYVDETTGSLEESHNLVLSNNDYPGFPGSVSIVRWTPDSCAMALAWSNGGIALWSTFGALLLCTLKWDYGLNTDPLRVNPLRVITMEWSAEGYQLWILKDCGPISKDKSHCKKYYSCRSVVQWDFVKSPLTVNPCMSHNGHIYLQGEDRLYINLGHKIFSTNMKVLLPSLKRSDGFCHVLSGTKQWLVVPIPIAYTSCNWPIRFTAIDEEGQSIAVAGKTGLAHYSMLSRKWKLFGNEYQERDFIVTGGLLWYHGYLITSSYSIPNNEDELRLYPRSFRLDNNHVKCVKMNSQILLLNILKSLLLVFCANSQIRIYNMTLKTEKGLNCIELTMMQAIDISTFCAHPACVVSASLTLIRTEVSELNVYPETLLINVSGKLIMLQRDHWLENTNELFTCTSPTVLASNVENLWISSESSKGKPHLSETVWLFCGAAGMRVWIPLFPKNDKNKIHTFISKRIMLPFQLKIYPLTILFEDAILLGAENDTVLYTSDTSSPFILPFSILELTSQVYVHQVIRQLIHRNLGYHAWKIARSFSSLPYFSHSLELLLHEVLEEEAMSKEPIPDALLPSVIEFINEFPGYCARAIVQCARKTEIALWPYLFSVVGPPKKLLQISLNNQELDTAASYLLILQNLEASSVSKQYATLLLDAALEQGRWDLSNDLVRFLRAIGNTFNDPNDVDSLKSSTTAMSKKSQTSGLSSEEDDLTLVLGTMQVSRNRSFSTTATPRFNYDSTNKDPMVSSLNFEKSKKKIIKRKKSVPMINKNEKNGNGDSSAEDFFIDVILQRHARKLLASQRLLDLGRFAAQLDFHLVIWMVRERDRAAKVDNYILALKSVHDQFRYPYPLFTLHDIIKLKNLRGNTTQQADTAVHETYPKKSTNEAYDIEFIDSAYKSSPTITSLYNYYTSNVNNVNIAYSPSLDLESNKNFKTANDCSSIASDISAVISGDDVLRTMENHADRACWTSTNSIEATDIASFFYNDHGSRAEVQLRYLLQIFLEAGCLGWAVIIAIVLKDVSAVDRAVRAACVSTQTIELTINLRDGLLKLIHWSNSECLGYNQILSTLQPQIRTLDQLIENKKQFQPQYHQPQEHESVSSNHNVSKSDTQFISNIVGTNSRRSSTTCNSNTMPCDDDILNERSRVRNDNSIVAIDNKNNDVNSTKSMCIIS